MIKPFRCTCGLKDCQNWAETQKDAAQLGASHIIAHRTYEIWKKRLPENLDTVDFLMISMVAAKDISNQSAIVAAMIAQHYDVLEEAIAHFLHFVDKKEDA